MPSASERHRRRPWRCTGPSSGRRRRPASDRPPRRASSALSSARRQRDRVARIAGWALTVRSSCSAGPSNMSVRAARPRRVSGVRKLPRRPARTSARAWPMPTDCEPWPGKTNANCGTNTDRISATDVLHALICVQSCTYAMHDARDDDELSPLRSRPRATSSRTRACCRTGSPWAARCGATWSSASPRSLAQLDLGFTQLAALYAADGTETLTIADLAEQIGRSPSATVAWSARSKRAAWSGAARRWRIGASARSRSPRRARACSRASTAREPSSSCRSSGRCRPAERALVAMGVAALSTHALTRRGRLIKAR